MKVTPTYKRENITGDVQRNHSFSLLLQKMKKRSNFFLHNKLTNRVAGASPKIQLNLQKQL